MKQVVLKALKEIGLEIAIITGKKVVTVATELQKVSDTCKVENNDIITK